MPKELLKQIEDCLPKESNAEVYIDGDYVNYWSKRITNERNKIIQDSKKSIPKMMDLIKDEIKKLKCNYVMDCMTGKIKNMIPYDEACIDLISPLSYPKNEDK